jgi:hypothetical protein
MAVAAHCSSLPLEFASEKRKRSWYMKTHKVNYALFYVSSIVSQGLQEALPVHGL